MKRRDLIKMGLVTAGGAVSAKAMANICLAGGTPLQPEGPFYPIENQDDTDADLTFLNNQPNNRALGEIITIRGVVTDQDCKPLQGVLIEIWQACESGRYNHPSDPNRSAALDPNFQYWGKAITNKKGRYKFKTIRPGSYPANADWVRPPHVHFKISKRGYHELITQMYFEGEPLNSSDRILRALPDTEQKKLRVAFEKQGGEDYPVGQFDIQIQQVK